MTNIEQSVEAVLNELNEIKYTDYNKIYDKLDELKILEKFNIKGNSQVTFATSFYSNILNDRETINEILHINKINTQLLKNYTKLKSYNLVKFISHNNLIHIINERIFKIETNIQHYTTFRKRKCNKALHTLKIIKASLDEFNFTDNLMFFNQIIKNEEWVKKAQKFDETGIFPPDFGKDIEF